MNYSRNPTVQKCIEFSLELLILYRELRFEKKEYVLSNQLLRSGTSIGANLEESIGAQSKRDFYTKVSIAYKEARECRYWLILLTEGNYIKNNHVLIPRIRELINIIGTMKKTTEKGLK